MNFFKMWFSALGLLITAVVATAIISMYALYAFFTSKE